MHIGNLEIKGRLFLAPMSNVTSMPFRILCKRYGASMVYSEMIHADAFLRYNEKTGKRAYFLEEERPIGIQLSGSSLPVLKKAIIRAEAELKPDIVDINIGCPAYSVMRNGCGAALLYDMEALRKIVFELSNSTKIPLTCKMRILQSQEKTVEIARLIEKSGAKALTVHGRTAKQRYSGKADWEIIRIIKKELSIPVILNGDIIDEKTADDAFRKTACDAVMIGRAAIGNPFIFKSIRHYLDSKSLLPKQTPKDRIIDFREYASICEEYGYMNIASIKMQAQNFVKGFSGSNHVKNRISNCKDIEHIINVLNDL